MNCLPESHLLERAQLGKEKPIEYLLGRYQIRLLQMIAAMLDPRLRARVDPEDIVQNALLRAVARLPKYLQTRPVPFLPWLKGLVHDELIRVHRQHLYNQRRSVRREQSRQGDYAADSSDLPGETCVGRDLSPCQLTMDRELRLRVTQTLNGLPESHREILFMRYARQMGLRAIAGEKGISEAVAKSRLWRARQSFRSRYLGWPGNRSLPDQEPVVLSNELGVQFRQSGVNRAFAHRITDDFQLCRPFGPSLFFWVRQPMAHATGSRCVGPAGLQHCNSFPNTST